MASRKRDEAEAAGEASAENILKNFYQEVVDEVDRKVHMSDVSTFSTQRMSTGLACLDLAIGGGIVPGMYTFAGQEGSCKTTSILTILGAGLKKRVPLLEFWDSEGSGGSDPDYLRNVLRTLGVRDKLEDVFGIKNKDGKWISPPKVRYRDEAVGETFFNWLNGIERRIPDKKLVSGSWWYIFEDNKVNRAAYSDIIDQKMTKQSGSGLFVPAKNGDLQGLILVDSWAAMNPEAMDDDDPSGALAVRARMFSAHLPRVKGRLRSKRLAILGVNQLRDIPMAMYGPKEQEPGGTALRFNSDCRMRLTARSLSGAPFHPKGEGQIEREKSTEVEKGSDTYRYIHARNIKNKLGLPMRETWMRLWVEDGQGHPRGFDPVFDCMYYLHQTGQLEGKRAALRLTLPGKEPSKSFSTQQFKELILGDKDTVRSLCKSIGLPPVRLRDGCFNQLQTGKAEELYLRAKTSKAKEDE